MFARKVSVRLKSNSLKQFTNLMDNELLPWLQTQKGFLGLITLASSDGTDVQVLSFWDQEDNAQAHYSSVYPAASNNLEALLDGVPYVRTFEVVSSTLEKFALIGSQESRHQVAQASPQDLGNGAYEATV